MKRNIHSKLSYRYYKEVYLTMPVFEDRHGQSYSDSGIVERATEELTEILRQARTHGGITVEITLEEEDE